MKEAAKITGDSGLLRVAENFQESGKLFSETGRLFRNAQKAKDLDDRINTATRNLNEIAGIEEGAFNRI
jgi:hypothetical protein